jgi:hypothetical protein
VPVGRWEVCCRTHKIVGVPSYLLYFSMVHCTVTESFLREKNKKPIVHKRESKMKAGELVVKSMVRYFET